MCLDFIKKLFEKKPEVLAEKVELGNLIEFLKAKNSGEIADIEKESVRYKDVIMGSFGQLREMIDRMRHMKTNDPFSRPSIEVKNNFCDRAILIIARGPNREMGASEFISASRKVLNDLNAISPRQAAHMQFFFKENLDEIARKMKSILAHIEEFSEYMGTNVISDIESIQKDILAIRENEKKMLYFEKNMDEIEKEIKELQAKEQKHSMRMSDMDENRLNRMKNEMASLNKEKQQLFQDIDTEFSSLEKLLKKYAHGLADKKSKALVEKYIESPSNSFFIYDKELHVKKVLESMKNAIEKKELEAEERKYVHLCSVLSNMDKFRQMRKDYQALMKKICEKESEIVREERIYEKAKRVHDDISEVRGRISDLSLMKKQLEESRAKIRELNEKKVKEMEFLISSGEGISVKIIY